MDEEIILKALSRIISEQKEKLIQLKIVINSVQREVDRKKKEIIDLNIRIALVNQEFESLSVLYNEIKIGLR